MWIKILNLYLINLNKSWINLDALGINEFMSFSAWSKLFLH